MAISVLGTNLGAIEVDIRGIGCGFGDGVGACWANAAVLKNNHPRRSKRAMLKGNAGIGRMVKKKRRFIKVL